VDRTQILQQLKEERTRIEHAIAALEGSHSHVVTAKPAPKRKVAGGITAAGRRKLSQMMKARWAERRKKATLKKK